MKRTLKDIKYRLSPKQVYDLICGKAYPYAWSRFFYQTRDRALLALLYLTGGRISEVLRLRKSQFDFDLDPNFVVIRDMVVVKRKKSIVAKEGYPIREVALPLKGRLAAFTRLVIKYLELLDEDEKLFKFTRQRAWQIVYYITGKWNHYFRSQAESYLGRYVFRRDPVGLAEYMGIKNVQTLREYVKTSWEDYKRELLK